MMASAPSLPPFTSHQPKITKSCRIRTSEKRAPNLFRIRTSKTQDLKSFRIRTYKKRRGEGSENLLPTLARNRPIFLRGQHKHTNRRAGRRNVTLHRRRQISRRIDGQSEKTQVGAGGSSDFR